MNNKARYAIIHYACQSFYSDNCGNSPLITAIGIYFPASGQTQVFSIAGFAEQNNIELKNISNIELEEIEKELLMSFYKYVKELKKIECWIHWNMKDSNYGFLALEQRFHKHYGKRKAPFDFDSVEKISLPNLLHQRYGENYISIPRLPSLIEKNPIAPLNFMTGKDEAKAFEQHEFLKIERSVQAKVQVFAHILELMANDELKTDSKKLRDIYGLSISGIITYVRENAILAAISGVVGTLLLSG